MKQPHFIILLCAVLSVMQVVYTAQNGVAKTPQIGWNTNFLGCNQNQTNIIDTIDFMRAKGWNNIGYQYILLDDCWQVGVRNSTTQLVLPNANRFPLGFKFLANYVHLAGMQFGLYSDSGFYTCLGLPGSFGYEQVDAELWASWGVDYVKYDNCYSMNVSQSIISRYTVMSDALMATGRPIFYSMCEWGWGFPGPWAPKIANSWRTTGDIPYACWECIRVYLMINDIYAPYSGIGGWNDPDMLQIGYYNEQQGRSQFSLWAIIKAPLIQSAPITNLSMMDYETLTNRDVIAINQDPLGKQGRVVDSQDSGQVGEYPKIDIPVLADCSGGPEQQWDYTDEGYLVERKTKRYLSVTQQNVPSVLPIPNFGNGWSFTNGFLASGARVLTRFEKTNLLVLETPLNATNQMFYYNYTDATIHWTQNNSMCLSTYTQPPLLVLAAPTANNTVAVALFNPLDTAQYITAAWQKVGASVGRNYTVFDVWEKRDMGRYSSKYTALVPANGVTLLKLFPL